MFLKGVLQGKDYVAFWCGVRSWAFAARRTQATGFAVDNVGQLLGMFVVVIFYVKRSAKPMDYGAQSFYF